MIFRGEHRKIDAELLSTFTNLNFTLKSIHSDKIQPFAILMKQTRTV